VANSEWLYLLLLGLSGRPCTGHAASRHARRGTIDIKIKEFLFCPNNAASCLPPIPPEGFQFLVIFQNLLSIILVFFIGLALRNYFRIK
jgi:hypothetical protein